MGGMVEDGTVGGEEIVPLRDAVIDSGIREIPMVNNDSRLSPLTLRGWVNEEGKVQLRITGSDLSFRNMVGEAAYARYLRRTGQGEYADALGLPKPDQSKMHKIRVGARMLIDRIRG